MLSRLFLKEEAVKMLELIFYYFSLVIILLSLKMRYVELLFAVKFLLLKVSGEYWTYYCKRVLLWE